MASCARWRCPRRRDAAGPPDVQPLAEAALAPGLEAVSYTLLAPAKTLRDIVDRLHAEMKRILAEPT